MKCKYYPEKNCDYCNILKVKHICCKDCIQLAICEGVCSYWKEYVRDIIANREVTNANK